MHPAVCPGRIDELTISTTTSSGTTTCTITATITATFIIIIIAVIVVAAIIKTSTTTTTTSSTTLFPLLQILLSIRLFAPRTLLCFLLFRCWRRLSSRRTPTWNVLTMMMMLMMMTKMTMLIVKDESETFLTGRHRSNLELYPGGQRFPIP